MALTKCKNCGHHISDKATICPHCGHALTHKEESTSKTSNEEPIKASTAVQSTGTFWKIATITLLIILLGMCAIFFYNVSLNHSTNIAEEYAEVSDTSFVEFNPSLEEGYHCWKLSDYNFFGDEIICEVDSSQVKRAFIGLHPFNAEINDNTLSGNVLFPDGREIFIVVNFETGECWSDRNIKNRSADFRAYKITPPTDTIKAHFIYRDRDFTMAVSEYKCMLEYQDVSTVCDTVSDESVYVGD